MTAAAQHLQRQGLISALQTITPATAARACKPPLQQQQRYKRDNMLHPCAAGDTSCQWLLNAPASPLAAAAAQHMKSNTAPVHCRWSPLQPLLRALAGHSLHSSRLSSSSRGWPSSRSRACPTSGRCSSSWPGWCTTLPMTQKSQTTGWWRLWGSPSIASQRGQQLGPWQDRLLNPGRRVLAQRAGSRVLLQRPCGGGPARQAGRRVGRPLLHPLQAPRGQQAGPGAHRRPHLRQAQQQQVRRVLPAGRHRRRHHRLSLLQQQHLRAL